MLSTSLFGYICNLLYSLLSVECTCTLITSCWNVQP